MNSTTELYATCPKGLESLLKQELDNLGAVDTRETVAGVYFTGTRELAYRICLWSRLANKILLPIAKYPSHTADDLYQQAVSLAWEEHIEGNKTFIVDFLGSNDAIRHSQFGAQTVKDAIVDRLRDITGSRPQVDKAKPDIRINARLSKNILHLSLDLSGESLHRRGYRSAQGDAPLKENLAAALLMRAGWSNIAAKEGALIDPMCGSGTLLIEAAMIAANIAPGLLRSRFGFQGWKQYHQPTFEALKQEAESLKLQGLAKELPEIRGYDADVRVLDAALANIEVAGLEKFVHLTHKSITEFKKPTHKMINPGLIICNPPYGERMGEADTLRTLYRTLGRIVKEQLPQWQLAVFTGNSELAKEMRLRPKKKYKFYNGTLACELLLFDIEGEGVKLREDQGNDPHDANCVSSGKATSNEQNHPAPASGTISSPGIQMVANRLYKNKKHLSKWLEKNKIECYRVYDADLPEYAAAVDIYAEKIHVQEYAAPKSIDEVKAQARLQELLKAVELVFQVTPGNIFLKTRRRTRGKEQYEKLSKSDLSKSDISKSNSTGNKNNYFVVNEGPAKLMVNLNDYLDAGLFLDHRPLRKLIGSSAQGKTFLNLFCYTASATVQAAIGGAKSSVSVDMSNTYLYWAEQNFILNNIHTDRHLLIRNDCFVWLKQCRQGFDIIMLDPPTFSNSKSMDNILDVQRDHVELVSRCMELLNPQGVLYFSTNLRRFKLEQKLVELFAVKDITQQTLDLDFKRNQKIHFCWSFQHKSS